MMTVKTSDAIGNRRSVVAMATSEPRVVVKVLQAMNSTKQWLDLIAFQKLKLKHLESRGPCLGSCKAVHPGVKM